MEIFALKPGSDFADEVYQSLQKGEGRFGWSYVPTADLYTLRDRIDDPQQGWDSLTDEEKDCYQSFLLDIHDGDYVVFINVPEWGRCTVAKVIGDYFWKWDPKIRDFNHRIPVDPNLVRDFDRNAPIVPPALSARLKLRGRWWHIYAKQEFGNLRKALSLPYPP